LRSKSGYGKLPGLMSLPQPAVPLDPPERLLCGPGPTNVAPAVLAAMRKPMLGHLDPDLHDILLEVVAQLRRVYGASEGLVLPLQATGTSGMETGILNLVEPGDTVVVGVCGFFGRRIAEQARRAGADVVEVEADWGEAVPAEEIVAALDRNPRTRLVALVHAETSTGVEQPIDGLADAIAPSGALLMVDCVTSLGGVPIEFDAWGIDYAYSCTQKCLAAPPGMSPIAVSERALERARSRTEPVPFSFDLGLLERYWVTRPATYHHTAPILHIYALHEALRLALVEGLDARVARHAEAGAHLRDGIEARGLELLADPEHRLAPLTAVRLGAGVDGKAVQTHMLREHGVEIGGGLGPQAPPMWRIGLMGDNATVATGDVVLAALDAALAATGCAPRPAMV
jgi:alanine-glyoxylate transaminase/serine-glyoxylate transaminase/serine-pyruvate transaminase